MTSSGLLSSSNIFPLNWSLMRTEDLSPWEETGEVEETDPKQRYSHLVLGLPSSWIIIPYKSGDCPWKPNQLGEKKKQPSQTASLKRPFDIAVQVNVKCAYLAFSIFLHLIS